MTRRRKTREEWTNGKRLTRMELISFDNLLQVLGEYGQAIRNEYQDNLIRSDRVASGGLLNSVEFEVIQQGRRFLVNLNLAEYWRFLEEGTKPHLPPISALLDWIKVKPILPRPGDNGKIPTPLQLAFAIRNKIGKEGTEGSQDLQKAQRTIMPQWEEKIADAFTRDVQGTMDGFIIEFFK